MSPLPQAFVDRVTGHLAADEGKFNYDQQLFTYLSHERFQRWVEVIGEHRPLAGVDAFSSGCGAGGSLVAYHEAGVATATGVEIDPVLAELGRLRVAGLDGVHALEYDGGRIPADDGRFDVVDSLDVLEHVGDADLYLRELIRVLRPGGCILLVTPNRVHPVEQHVRIVGPPWLPIRLANVAYYRAGEVIERRPAGADLGWRMRSVRAVRERNVGFVGLRRLAKRHGLFLQQLHPDDSDVTWPQPEDARWKRTLARHRLGKFVAPTRHLVVLLWKDTRPS